MELYIGFFYSRNLWYILDRLDGKLKGVVIILITCLFLIVPIWNLGGFRYYAAVHAFLYGLLPYILEGKKKKLIWSFLTPFIFHYAFILPVAILAIYMVLGNRIALYFYFFIFSLFINGINLSFFNNLVKSYAPTSFAERSKSYRKEETVEAFKEGEMSQSEVWYARYNGKFINYSIFALLIISFWRYKRVIKNRRGLFRLFSCAFLFYGFANLFSSLPSGGRYLAPAGILALSALIIFLQNYEGNKNLKMVVKVVSPFLILFIVVQLRESWYYTSLFTLIGNPIASLFSIGQNLSLNDLIKGI